MHHLLAVLVGALAGAMSATVPVYATTPDPPEEVLLPADSVALCSLQGAPARPGTSRVASWWCAGF
jgi:hypothetical protein